MKTLYTLAFLMIFSALPMLSYADNDEFTSRFWNQSGLGFLDPQERNAILEQRQILANDMDNAAQELQNIMPAAGDETTESEQPQNQEMLEENVDTDIGP